MEQEISIKQKRNKAATCVYKVIKPIYYLSHSEIKTIEQDHVFIGCYSWLVDTQMSLVQLGKYVKEGFIEKIKAKDYLAHLGVQNA